MSGNLLVVDWDFFFNNPVEGGTYSDEDQELFDWSHSESQMFIKHVWTGRAAAFLLNDRPLPRCEGYEGFWDRFDLGDAERRTLVVGDSNVWAGSNKVTSVDGLPWDSVWLYDAHHDSGYRRSADAGKHTKTLLKAWRDEGRVTCENWMLVHHDLGSELHVRYPQWKIRAFQFEKTTWIPLDRQFDDGQPPPVVFDQVYLCRSGAWVPAWCDDQFAEFVAAFPGEHKVVGPDMARAFDLADVQKLVHMRNMLREGHFDQQILERGKGTQ